MHSNNINTHRIQWGLVIHGGVGVLPQAELTPDLEAAYRQTLSDSLSEGYRALREGGTSADAIVASIQVMEDSVLFNAGRGSNFTTDGVVSMDASIMAGNTLEAGAVAGVSTVRNPISLARAVMEDCPHVMLAGSGAEGFARQAGLGMEEEAYFFTQRRWDDLQEAKAREALGEARPNTVDVSAGSLETPDSGPDEGPVSEDLLKSQSGTVGAVALDPEGCLVAGTSTGGSANKKWGRIGDSPVIAAGTYAGSHCGVSCTGWGEYFIRHAVAYDIQARMVYLGLSLTEATRQVILGTLENHRKGLGGVVAMDKDGNIEMCYNTQGMYRGWVDEEGRIEVAIF